MADNDSNPFKKLAEEFARRTAAAKDATGPERRDDAHGVQPPRDGFSLDSRDILLFLDAVRRIRPLPKRGQERTNPTLGDILAAKMKDRQPGPPLPPRLSPAADTGMDTGEPEPHAARSGVPNVIKGRCSAKAKQPAPAGERENFREMLEAEQNRHNAQSPSPEEEALFVKAMRGVSPVSGKGREVAAAVEPSGAGAGHDPVKALKDLLEGRVEFALHHSDEYMEGFVVGVDPLVMARLRGGQYSPEAHVDLHGLNARQAYDALVFFLKNAYMRGLRTVVIVTGRGRNSPDGIGVLRGLLQHWLCRDPFKRVVLAFCTARPHDGGPGAVYVLLRKYKKNRGKIIWERKPSDDDFPDL